MFICSLFVIELGKVIKMKFGNILKELRKEKGLTQRELAKLLNISNSSLAMYETDKREPDFELVKKIAEFFDVTMDYLLGNNKSNSTEQNGSQPYYVELNRVVQNMNKKEVEKVLDFAKYLNLEGKKKLPDDDDDF